ncbi:MAG: hypothetical protein IT211_04175 [Armatimonadetes bacterium]|nr:hypothetical protein [Armatimonadota bacterium]
MSHIPSAVDRYLNGTMSAQEQTEFAAQVAADPTLRATLEAEQVIRNTVRNDLAAFPAEHALTRSRVMESLAAVKAPVGIAVGGGGAWYASAGLIKGVLGVVAVVGLSVGGYLWMEQSNNSIPEPVAPVAAPVVVAPQATPLAMPESSSVTTSAATAPAPEDTAPLAKPATKQTTQNIAERASRGNASSRSSSDAATPQQTAQAAATTEEGITSQATRPAATARQLRVVNKDSVKLKVQVKVK